MNKKLDVTESYYRVKPYQRHYYKTYSGLLVIINEEILYKKTKIYSGLLIVKELNQEIHSSNIWDEEGKCLSMWNDGILDLTVDYGTKFINDNEVTR